ncbi:hypothetical protein AB0B21_35615 [Streptomyces rimosus]|uniref:hypothetical protein n=1 Tax=Streptomyces rimosus TaxID=1927 RepID=UPI00051863F5|nr:hypothetical protein [Streptomyces rimosus]KOT92435.1 membrane protein [Streptomyces rimosus subsp. pseudoverticillatus]
MLEKFRAQARGRRAARRTHADYTGGVYGSLLAASVVVGASTLGAFPRLELALLLLATGVVFWLAHVHAQLFGARMAQHTLNRATVLHVCREEWPIVEAAVPSTVAVLVSPLLGLDIQGASWLALAVALISQMGWATAAARRAGAVRRQVVLTDTVNLVIGLLIVALKFALKH